MCGGSGVRFVNRPNGTRAVADCECRIFEKRARQLAMAGIPPRFRECTLDNFVVNRSGLNESLGAAKWRAEEFVKAFPWSTYDTGLLFIGPCGVGKTHLAIGILNALIAGMGIRGKFVDCKELLKQIQESYSPSVLVTERQVLRPALEAEVLVLDEIGATRKTEWASEMIEHILNMRYNNQKTTIITTNFENAPPGASSGLQSVASKDTLGDRIGDRMLSRLQEMCFVVNIEAPDYRSSGEGKASFAPTLSRSIRVPGAE